MTNLGQLSFNTTNIDVSVVRTTFNANPTTGPPTYQFPNVRTPDVPTSIAGTGDFYQNTLANYRDPQSAQWNFTVERELVRDLTLRESYVGMNSYRMSQTVDLNQVEPSNISPNPNPKPYPNWGRILSTNNAGHVNYQALQSELNQRLRGRLTLQASHVWAKSLGNVGGDARRRSIRKSSMERQWQTDSIWPRIAATWRKRGATGSWYPRFTTYPWEATADSLAKWQPFQKRRWVDGPSAR